MPGIILLKIIKLKIRNFIIYFVKKIIYTALNKNYLASRTLDFYTVTRRLKISFF